MHTYVHTDTSLHRAPSTYDSEHHNFWAHSLLSSKHAPLHLVSSSLSGGFESRLELNEFFLDGVQEKLISALKPPDEKTHGKGGNP